VGKGSLVAMVVPSVDGSTSNKGEAMAAIVVFIVIFILGGWLCLCDER
jgi:hypothetical protein